MHFYVQWRHLIRNVGEGANFWNFEGILRGGSSPSYIGACVSVCSSLENTWELKYKIYNKHIPTF